VGGTGFSEGSRYSALHPRVRDALKNRPFAFEDIRAGDVLHGKIEMMRTEWYICVIETGTDQRGPWFIAGYGRTPAEATEV